MCDITNDEPSGDLNYFGVFFYDCEENQGTVHFELLHSTSKSYLYSIKGLTPSPSNLIDEEILIAKTEGINPTKVFKKIAEILKEILCPECV